MWVKFTIPIVFYKKHRYDYCMRKMTKYKKKINNYFFDHYKLYQTLKILGITVVAALSAFIYAFGFTSFTSVYQDGALSMVMGGITGLSQTIVLVVKLLGGNDNGNILQSVIYFAINIPIVLFAFFKLSKRFAIFTAINVGLSSLFIY